VIEQPLETRSPKPLRLRTLTAADADAFARHVARDLEHLHAHLPWAESAAHPAGARAFLELYDRGEEGRVTIAGAFDGDALVGGALLLNHKPDLATVEIGCWVAGAAEGLGVARAACAALVEHARAELAVERIEWHCTTTNPRSRALAERLGFQLEGTLRSAYVLHGERYDLDVLSLVGDEITRRA
jgi:RimJ/RimL family protein N-acetyltransferase